MNFQLSTAMCLNCVPYQWELRRTSSSFQDIFGESLMRCQKCKMAYYCGRDCQTEHWIKVHKERCKYQRGDTEQVAGVHRHLVSMCNGCKEDQDMGKEKWGCHMQSRLHFWNNPIMTITDFKGEKHEASLAVEIGELTGKFFSRYEHVVSVLQKILHKMDVSGHPLSRNELFIDLTKEVFNLRHGYLMQRAVIPSSLVKNCHGYFSMKCKEVPFIIYELCENYKDDVEDVYRLWDTFVLIFDYFLDFKTDIMEDFENIEYKVKDKADKLLLGKVQKSVGLEKKWEMLTSILSSGPVPYLSILEIVIGSLSQKCSSCMKKIDIECMDGEHPIGSAREKIPNFICNGIIIRFYCKLNCRSEVVNTFRKDTSDLLDIAYEAMEDHLNDRCDWCGDMRKALHRCRRCLSKRYCSNECANMDWLKVHKEVCKEKPEGWKIKERLLWR